MSKSSSYQTMLGAAAAAAAVLDLLRRIVLVRPDSVRVFLPAKDRFLTGT